MNKCKREWLVRQSGSPAVHGIMPSVGWDGFQHRMTERMDLH